MIVTLTVLTTGTASAATVSPSITVSFGGAEAAPPNFWGMDYASSHGPGPDPASLLAKTPTRVLIYPAANDTETTNITSGLVYVHGGTFQAPVSLEDFIATCEAISCKAIIGLPMEINSPSTDAYEARYVVDTLHFSPAYFLYGNEPAHWTCFGVSWAELAAGHRCDTGNTTITAFATETEAVIRAVTAALGSNTPPSMCLGGSGNPGPEAEEAWIHGLLANSYDHTACAAYAMHSHPAYSNKGKPTLESFYATLTASKGLADGYQNASRATDGAPLYMTEVGTFTPRSVFVKPYMGTWAMDVFDSALMVQSMQNRVPDMGWWAWDTGGADGFYFNQPTTLYDIVSTMFSKLGNLWMPSQFVGQEGIFAEATMNATGWSVLVVSTNVDQDYKIQLDASAFNLGACGHVLSWTSSGSGSQTICPAGNGFTVPSQSVLLLSGARVASASPSAVPVSFDEVGLPSGTVWSVTLNGSTTSSASSSITETEANGSYPYSVGTIGGFQSSPDVGSLTVDGSPVAESIAFTATPVPKYDVLFEARGLPVGLEWSATIDGSTAATTNGSLEFDLPSGTYSFSVSAPLSYEALPNDGQLTVNASAVTESVAFSNVLPPASSVTLTGSGSLLALPHGAEAAVVVAAVLAVAAVCGFVLLMRRRSHRPIEPEAPDSPRPPTS